MLLHIDKLSTWITVETETGLARKQILHDISLDLERAGTTAIVGESGSGKSVTALSILRLLEESCQVDNSGSIVFDDREMLGLDREEMRTIRGNRIAMIFQEPMTSLNPVLTVGHQIAETVRVHQGLSWRDAWKHAVEALGMVRIPDAPRRARMYPHQLSGGMRQRVMIAMALACRPKLLIADEPTTALDVTIQAQILALLSELQAELGTAIVLITHDLGVVCETADRVIVLYAGARAEEAGVEQLFDAPGHPYTQGLMASIPRRALRQGPGRLHEIPGVVPAPDQIGHGCAFAGRCPRVLDVCRTRPPELRTPAPGHQIACFNPAPQGGPDAAA